jgi:flagellar assembly protein FliH
LAYAACFEVAAHARSKSFLLLFFKKEGLAFFNRRKRIIKPPGRRSKPMDGLAPAFLFDDAPSSFARTPTGILYVEDFDAPADVPDVPPAPPAAPEPPAPVIGAADLAAARAEGHAAGLAEARAEQALIQTALRTAALASIGDALGSARADASRLAQGMAEELAATMLALLQAALPAASAALAGQEVGALIAALLPGLKREPHVVIQVPPALVAEIAASLRTLWPDHGARLVVAADETLAASDVRVTWEDGEARRDTRALWDGLQSALAPYRLPPLDAIMAGGSDDR